MHEPDPATAAPAPAATPPPTPLRPRRPPWLTSLAAMLGPALLLLAGLAGILVWMATTTSGLRLAVVAVNALVPGVAITDVQGTLRDGLRFGSLNIVQPHWSLHVGGLELEPREWAPLSARVDLQRVAAQRVQVEWAPGEGPTVVPATLGVPVELTVRQLNVQELALGARGSHPVVLRDVDAAGRIGPQRYVVERASAAHDRTRLAGSGRLDALPPFDTSVDLKLSTELQGRAVTATVTARGPLRALQVGVNADDDAARADVSAEIDAFGDVPLRRLNATIDAFDPALWFSGTPGMQLRGHARFEPVTRADGRWALSGPIALTNSAPGPLDRQRLPVRAARGTLTWSAADVDIVVDHVEGLRGTASGSFQWSDAAGIDARIVFNGVDAATLHTALRPTNAAGQLRYRLADGTHRFDGDARSLSGLPLVAEIAATLRDDLLELSRGELRLGSGRAQLRGRLALSPPQAGNLAGTFGDLDLSQLVKGLDTRLNGTLDASGQIATRRGQARFALSDSRIAGRPITGQGTLQLDAGRLDIDADLRSGPAWVAAKGGLGAGRELRVDLLAPDLAPLLPGYGGRVEAHAVFSGELEAVRVTGNAGAANLALPGGHRASPASSRTSPRRRCARSTARRRAGTRRASQPRRPRQFHRGRGAFRARHHVQCQHRTHRRHGQRTAAARHAERRPAGSWWRGALVAAQVGAPLQLVMRAPAPLVLAPGVVEFGPASFRLRGARFSEVERKHVDGRWRSAGVFEGLQPQALDAAARAPRRVVRTGTGDRVPLTLAGRWSLEWSDKVSGIAFIERTGGVYSGIDGLTPSASAMSARPSTSWTTASPAMPMYAAAHWAASTRTSMPGSIPPTPRAICWRSTSRSASPSMRICPT